MALTPVSVDGGGDVDEHVDGVGHVDVEVGRRLPVVEGGAETEDRQVRFRLKNFRPKQLF
jgi:hypothetical protein